MAWFLTYRHKGRDAYPQILEFMRNKKKTAEANERVRYHLMEAFGYFMTESSGHISEYIPWYRKRKDLMDKFRGRTSAGKPGLPEDVPAEPAPDLPRHGQETDRGQGASRPYDPGRASTARTSSRPSRRDGSNGSTATCARRDSSPTCRRTRCSGSVLHLRLGIRTRHGGGDLPPQLRGGVPEQHRGSGTGRQRRTRRGPPTWSFRG